MAETEWKLLSATQRLAELQTRVKPALELELAGSGFKLGDNALLRIMKESSELEVWLSSSADEPHRLWKTFAIAKWSGALGPKLKEGDGQAPEGVYSVTTKSLHPSSNYHLAMNIGYPNGYDQSHQRTGSLIMIHGSNVSVGCFAMTDAVIEQLYLIASSALVGGQKSIPVYCFPFRMSTERLAKLSSEEAKWMPFWQELKVLWDAFENKKIPPRVHMTHGHYRIHQPLKLNNS